MDNQQCANCGDIFNGRKRKFCDHQCKKRYQNRKYKGRDLSLLEPKGSVIASPRLDPIYCPVCETPFKPKMITRGTKPNRYQARQEYCSKQCGIAGYWRANRRPLHLVVEVEALLKMSANRRSAGKRKQKYIDGKHKEALHNHCRKCGSDIEQRSRQMCVRFCNECKDKAKASAKRTHRRKYGSYKSHKARAIKHGVPYELVNRVKVFEIYGWKCAKCKVVTPKALMRSYDDPRAPTLDHIVPISKGGPHLYSNVQLLCRKCNYQKGNDSDMLI